MDLAKWLNGLVHVTAEDMLFDLHSLMLTEWFSLFYASLLFLSTACVQHVIS